MKNKFFKRIMSLVLVVVMAMSAMVVSAVSASAVITDSTISVIESVKYNFKFHTAGTDGKSSDDIKIRINGTSANGNKSSSEWHNVGKVADSREESASFSDINIQNIESITVQKSGNNAWYPEYIELTVESLTGGKIDLTFYGGRWVNEGNKITLALTDKVLKLNVVTSSDYFSGTDADIIVNLYGENDYSTGNINLSDIYPKFNAFERKDDVTFYFAVPEDFGTLKKAIFTIDLGMPADNIFTAGSDWKLGSLDFAFNGNKFSNTKVVNKWLSGSESAPGQITVKF